LASSAKESREARASALCVITQASARAVSAGFVAVAVNGVLAGGAFLQVARGSAVAGVAEAAHVLHGVPRLGVDAAHLGGQVLLRPASATVIAVAGADSSLASNAFVSGEAVAGTSLSVAQSLVGAFRPRRQIISILNRANPSEILGAGS